MRLLRMCDIRRCETWLIYRCVKSNTYVWGLYNTLQQTFLCNTRQLTFLCHTLHLMTNTYVWRQYMQCCAVCCFAVCCSVLQCVAVCCSVLQCVAVCCSVWQCVAAYCIVLQCVAECCTFFAERSHSLGTSKLQCVALQHVTNTNTYVWRWYSCFDCFICTTWLVHMCDIQTCILTLISLFQGYSCARCVTWLIQMCDMTHA